ncbi:MAG TPA: hypothetical protein VFV66_20650 [Nonomuraea sp.]|nr:hypothetical protein [Nonomuraea sp.]
MTIREMGEGRHLWYLGNPDRPPYVPVPTTVVLRGWRRGLWKISLTKAIQRQADLGLTDAKRCVDRLLAGEAVTNRAAERGSRRHVPR